MWACAYVPAAHRIRGLRIVSQRSQTGWFVLVLVTLNGASLFFVIQSKKRNVTIKIHPVLFSFKRRLYHICSLHQTRWARINGILLLIKDFSWGSLGCQRIFARYPPLSWISSHCLCIIPCLYVMVYCKSRVCRVQMLLMDIWQAHVATDGAQGPTGHDMTLYNRVVVRTEVGLNTTCWNSLMYKTFNLRMRSAVVIPHW